MPTPATRRTILAAQLRSRSSRRCSPSFPHWRRAPAPPRRARSHHTPPHSQARSAPRPLTARTERGASAATLTPTSIQTDYKRFIAVEGKVISAAPSQLRGDFQTLFSYTTNIYNELNKVGWNYRKVPPTFFSSLASKTTLGQDHHRLEGDRDLPGQDLRPEVAEDLIPSQDAGLGPPVSGDSRH